MDVGDGEVGGESEDESEGLGEGKRNRNRIRASHGYRGGLKRRAPLPPSDTATQPVAASKSTTFLAAALTRVRLSVGIRSCVRFARVGRQSACDWRGG